MATKQHRTQDGDDSFLGKVKGALSNFFEPISQYQPAHSINSVTRTNGKVYKVEVSLTYACSTPSIINTFTREDELIYVEEDGDLKFVPQNNSHRNLKSHIIEGGREEIREQYL